MFSEAHSYYGIVFYPCNLKFQEAKRRAAEGEGGAREGFGMRSAAGVLQPCVILGIFSREALSIGKAAEVDFKVSWKSWD